MNQAIFSQLIALDISRTFLVREKLSFSDKALIVFDPEHAQYAFYFFRIGNELRIYDDIEHSRTRRSEGLKHNIDSASSQLARAETLDEFLQDIGRFYWNALTLRQTAKLAVQYLYNLTPAHYYLHPDFKHSQGEECKAAFRQYRDELLFHHIGISLEEMAEREDAPQDTLRLRPLAPTNPVYLTSKPTVLGG